MEVKVFDTKEGRDFERWCLGLGMASFRNQAHTSEAISSRQKTDLMDIRGSGRAVHNAMLLGMVAQAETVEKYQRLADTVKALGHHERCTQLMHLLSASSGPASTNMDQAPAGKQYVRSAQTPQRAASLGIPTLPVPGVNSPPPPPTRTTIPGSPSGDRFWNTDQKQDSDYDKLSSTRGIALIINNKNFPNAADVRNGTDIDRDALVKLWTDLRFKTDFMNDVEGEDMRIKLRTLAADPGHKSYDCVVICILSHGSTTTVCGSDDVDVPIDDLVELFHNDKVHRSLVGKPKMFFIQACRGGRKAQGVVSDAPGGGTSSIADASGTAPSKKVHTSTADVLVCFSTAPGHLSWRNVNSGSWYIQCLVDVFYEHHKKEHVLDMMTRVTGALAKKCTEEKHQTPSFRSQLKAKVFLRETKDQRKLWPKLFYIFTGVVVLVVAIAVGIGRVSISDRYLK